MKIDSLCVHGTEFAEHTGAVSVPIYQSVTFKHPALGLSTGFDYSRMQNPTRLALEQTIATLECGIEGFAYSSGMAAIANVLELFSPGSHIIASTDLYGGIIRYFRSISEKNGLSFSFVNTGDLMALSNAIKSNTVALFVETPTNPMMDVTDIEAASKIAKRHNILLIVDNTFLSPYFQRPLTLGADIVVHSGSKYLAGHNDTLAGLAVAGDTSICERLRFVYKTVGSCLSPFDSWLVLRGIKTLGLRMSRQQANAMAIAEFLSTHKRVKKIYYAGLSSHPGYNVMKKQTSGFGSMISFEVDTADTAINSLSRLRIIAFAESLGGVESLMTYPTIQTHGDVPETEKNLRGINDRLLRLSVGIEDVTDLIDDLNNALQ
ncbi:MAG: PLP-dependent aspartate aminotransferase family protein [Christensenellaceae bacterium]|jgi:cystathionine beta-lyase/cystathionine gamma-synthase|nr:PLP-dependent aspartate aminotransferase family protein [Christensenellaceae bacterium]